MNSKIFAVLFFILIGVFYKTEAQTPFKNFLAKIKTVEAPLIYDSVFFDSTLSHESGYLEVTDTMIKQFINQQHKGFGINFKFKDKMHRVQAIGKMQIDSSHFFVLCIFENKDSFCDYKRLDVFYYDTSGVMLWSLSAARKDDCIMWREYNTGRIEKNGDVFDMKREFRRKDGNSPWIEDKSEPYYCYQYFENDQFHVSDSKGEFHRRSTPLQELPKPLYYDKFTKFIADFPVLKLPLYIDSTFLKGPGKYKEMDSFGYTRFPSDSSFPYYIDKTIKSYSSYFIGKVKINEERVFCLYLTKYHTADTDKIWNVNYAVFNTSNAEHWSGGTIAKIEVLTDDIIDNSLFVSFPLTIESSCIDKDFEINTYNPIQRFKINPNGSVRNLKTD